MEKNISKKKKQLPKTIILFILLLLIIITMGYLLYTSSESNNDNDIHTTNTDTNEANNTENKEDIPTEEEATTKPDKSFEEYFPVIEEQQAYVVVPTLIEDSSPPVLVIYSHGSNTSVTQNMQDQFMKDMQSYGTYLTQYNYIFAASNQHGVNWGNTASIQDTLKLKEWVDNNYIIQPKIYLIGFSMGGLPTMNFTTTYPKLVSKIALLAPTVKSSEWNQERVDKIMDIQIKLWHGNKDVNVPYSYSVYFVNKLKEYGKEIQFVTLEGKTHFDIDTEYMQDILYFFSS